ncbi:uncharacterized protein LOC143856550 [Tasmannia lanceolata]|uniref:uncharacterized protein LOC143856550 n=1 Tax=Tasmannia lanceolata TaxID=3420 RepID=UPI004062CE43
MDSNSKEEQPDFSNLLMLINAFETELSSISPAHFPPPISSSSKFYRRPYKKLRSSNSPPHGWLVSHLRMRGTPPLYFGHKVLTLTDTGPNHYRFLLSKDMAGRILSESNTAMTEAEKERARSPKGGLNVVVLDLAGREWELEFKYWNSNKAQVFSGRKWRELVEANGLVEKVDRIHVFVFRAAGIGPGNSLLRFALIHETKE